jgi:hypothetical protein
MSMQSEHAALAISDQTFELHGPLTEVDQYRIKFVFFLAMHPEIDDEQVHCELEVDLVEHP